MPPLVRREYPGLFVEIPERFANGRFSAVERVKQALLPAPFQREPVSVADVDKFIEHAHWHLDTLRCERTRRVALNPDMGRITTAWRKATSTTSTSTAGCAG